MILNNRHISNDTILGFLITRKQHGSKSRFDRCWQKEKKIASERTRTPNLSLRRAAPYPLGHGCTCSPSVPAQFGTTRTFRPAFQPFVNQWEFVSAASRAGATTSLCRTRNTTRTIKPIPAKARYSLTLRPPRMSLLSSKPQKLGL